MSFDTITRHYHEYCEVVRACLRELHSLDRNAIDECILVAIENRSKLAIEQFQTQLSREVEEQKARSDQMHISRGMHNSTLAINAHRAIEQEGREFYAKAESELTHLTSQVAVYRARIRPDRA